MKKKKGTDTKMKKKTARDNGKILSGICFALIIGFWCIATYGGFVSDLFLPSPTEVARKIVDMAKDGSLWANCWESTARVLVGWDQVCGCGTSGRNADGQFQKVLRIYSANH